MPDKFHDARDARAHDNPNNYNHQDNDDGEDDDLAALADLDDVDSLGAPQASQPNLSGELPPAAKPGSAAPEPGHEPTTEPLAPPESGSAELGAPTIGERTHSDILPTLERRERRNVPGKPTADAYIRTHRADSPYFKQKAGELIVDVPAPAPRSGAGRAFRTARDILFGRPLTTAQQIHERLTKVKALAVLSSDAISSVAYATEASLGILITAGLTYMSINPWIAAAIALLMVIVGTSYYQTIHAYPHGGGSYIVARANLGDWPGLVAAAALLIDYVLTVSVSISAGVDAIVSIDSQQLQEFSVAMGVAFILIIMVVNLRGISDSGAIFAAPTYLFIACFLIMIVTGIIHAAMLPGGLWTPITPQTAPHLLGWEPQQFGILLALTAFASGCSAMTGVEAISNGVPAFKPPESNNAARTLIAMIATLVTLFVGTTYLAWRYGVEPYQTGSPTVTSQIAGALFLGNSYSAWFYYLLQIATMLILALAANTSYADFPRLASILAIDGWLPKGLSFKGNRLAFSGGIFVLTILATVLMVVFNGNTSALINLYALGVFTAFTLSQSGMVAHWWRLRREPHANHWLRSMLINGIGALTTGIVAVVIMITKFDRGAWIVVVLVPILVLMFRAISAHYQSVRNLIDQLDVTPVTLVRHQGIAPIARMDRVAERTLTYARSLGMQVTAVHIATEQEKEGDIREEFNTWVRYVEDAERLVTGSKPKAPTPQLVIIRSPFRSLVTPMVEYVRMRHERDPYSIVTVFLPEYIPAHLWERLLHNETAFRVKLALYSMPNVVVTNVPYHLREPEQPPPDITLRKVIVP